MKVYKTLFLLSYILLVGCSGEVSNNQQNVYSNNLKDQYPEYSYSYINKADQYEIEITNDVEKALTDDGMKKNEVDSHLRIKSFKDEYKNPQNHYSAFSLNEVFEKEGKHNKEVIDLFKEKQLPSLPYLEYISGDIISTIKHDSNNIFFISFKGLMMNKLSAMARGNKAIKVLTDEPFIFISNNQIQLAQNTKSGVYTIRMDDQTVFNFIEKIYASEESIENKYKAISYFLYLNQEIFIALDALNDDFSTQNLNERLFTLYDFKNKNDIIHDTNVELMIREYKKNNVWNFGIGAVALASENRNNFIKNGFNDNNKPIIKEDKVEVTIPRVNYKEKDNEILYRGDGVESKYTYKSILIQNAVKEVSKIAKIRLKNNYAIVENEIGQLGITIYSEEVQDEVVENYILDPYTKKITNREEYSPDNSETVSMVINEAISVIEQETTYSSQSGYIMDAYVTDDGYIAVDINIGDNNNSGKFIKKDQAVYNPKTRSIKEFPKDSPSINNNNLNENSVIIEAISLVEEKTGYIEGDPYVYDAYKNEEDGSVIVEVRAAGAGNSGTMSIVDRFKCLPQSDVIYIYDTLSNSYNQY